MSRTTTSDSVAPETLASKLGDWLARDGPLYARLGESIADAHAHGLLGDGMRLPSERLFARHLGISRSTVVAAYEHLRSQATAETRRGSGTWLCGGDSPPAQHQFPLLSRLVDPRRAPIDLAICALQASDELGEVEVKLSEALCLLPPHGYSPLGAPRLRDAIAQHLTHHRGVPTRPEEVLVTNGASGALSLIAYALLHAGDHILVEAPTYPGALEIFSRAGARLEGVERDHAGMLPAGLERSLASRPTRMLYLVPTCHNPTGSVMSELRRREILRIAAESQIPVIEDTVMADLLGRTPPPDLAAIDADGVVLVGSLSKCFWGGLRIGWIRAPAETVLRLGRARAAMDLGSPGPSQAVALAVLEDFERATSKPRALAKARLDVLVRELRTRLPSWRFAEPAGGLSVWASLPTGSAEELAQIALRHGVAISAGTASSPHGRHSNHVRLCAGPSPELIREGVRQLAIAWDEMSAAPAQSAHRLRARLASAWGSRPDRLHRWQLACHQITIPLLRRHEHFHSPLL